ncbi:MAG TPA: hypothetical protein VN809_05065 [Telmatospirillum sp.]|nr:hypothetical protein [Telmatospirillum sp.]
MSRWSRFLFLALTLSGAVWVSGCTEAPYVDDDYRYHQRGIVKVCFSESNASMADAKALADEACRQYERTAKLALIQPYQCTWSTSTLATFSCVARPGETPPPYVERLSPMRHDQTLGPM